MESTIPPPERRSRRKRKQNAGPPTLQFVTATDPKQFRDQSILRGIRSQAMIQYRYKADQQKKKNVANAAKDRVWVSPVPEKGSPLPPRRSPVVPPASPFWTQPEIYINTVRSPRSSAEHNYSSLVSWLDSSSGETAADTTSAPSVPSIRTQSSRYHRALSVIQLNNARHEMVTDYTDTEWNEERNLHRMWAFLSQIGDGVDPFNVLPQFVHPKLSVIALVRRCNRIFTCEATLAKWIPLLFVHPHSLLSSVCLVSTYLDMRNGCAGDSERTVLIKGEVIAFINERLRCPETQVEDMTLVVILHLLAGELWTCNEKTLAVHESGVARIVSQRGGMQTLGAGALTEVCAAVMYHSSVLRESVPLPIFANWQPPRQVPLEASVAIPESPIYCPRSEFFTLASSRNCSEHTYELICDMRELTDLFLDYHDALNTVERVEEDDLGTSRLASPPTQYEDGISQVRSRLVSLPSAYTPGTAVSNDWIYESCRIAALIYVTSIVNRVPFSAASDLAQTPLLSNSTGPTAYNLRSIRLVDALFETLSKTDMGNVWGEMSGVLYWVTLIGAAAARHTIVPDNPLSLTSEETYSAWARRCLSIFGTRTLIILIFQHPVPITLAQKRMLRVQEIVGSSVSRRLV